MNKLGNFLWKLFSVTMVFLYHTVPDRAVAEETTTTKYITNDPKITSEYFISKEDTNGRQTRTLTLCNSGEYLSSCGASIVGTNWLKGMTKPGNVRTPDYYSYNALAEDTINMENLRKFFNHTETINYTKRTASSSASGGYVYTDSSVLPGAYTKYLNQILSNFCTDAKGNITNIQCERCPNNASIAKSTVIEDTYETGKILWDSWDVHTIADCYMREFNDNTGTYIYVANNIQDSTTGTNCYYSDEKIGSSLYYK